MHMMIENANAGGELPTGEPRCCPAGFTFMCGKTRQRKFQLRRKTRPDRIQAKRPER
jgi:hypothetical protein